MGDFMAVWHFIIDSKRLKLSIIYISSPSRVKLLILPVVMIYDFLVLRCKPMIFNLDKQHFLNCRSSPVYLPLVPLLFVQNVYQCSWPGLLLKIMGPHTCPPDGAPSSTLPLTHLKTKCIAHPVTHMCTVLKPSFLPPHIWVPWA